MVTYIIFRQEWSDLADRKHGRGYVWKIVARVRFRPPRDYWGFHSWLWHLAKRIPARYRINRTQEKYERKGFHGVWKGWISETGLITEKSYTQHKAIPHLPLVRQPFWQTKPERRKGFRKMRNRFSARTKPD